MLRFIFTDPRKDLSHRWLQNHHLFIQLVMGINITTTTIIIMIIVTIISTTYIIILSAFNVTGNSWRRRQEGLADQLVEQVGAFIMMMVMVMVMVMIVVMVI